MHLQKQEKLPYENKKPMGYGENCIEVLGIKNIIVKWKTMLTRITSGRDATENPLVSWRTKELSQNKIWKDKEAENRKVKRQNERSAQYG